MRMDFGSYYHRFLFLLLSSLTPFFDVDFFRDLTLAI